MARKAASTLRVRKREGEGLIKLDGVSLKKDNWSKVFTMAIAGVDNIEVYGVTSSSDSVGVSVVATAADGATQKRSPLKITAPGNTAVVKVQLDKAKTYTVDSLQVLGR